MLDEILNKSLSSHLETKLADFYKNKDIKKAGKSPNVSKPKELTENKNEINNSVETDQLIDRDDCETERIELDSCETVTSAKSATSEKSALTYKSLSDDVFYWTALLQHVITLYLAISLKGIEGITEFIGSIGCSMLFFIFPSIAYITALSRFGSSRIRQKGETIFYQVLSCVLLVSGILLLVSYFYVLFERLTGKIPEGSNQITA